MATLSIQLTAVQDNLNPAPPPAPDANAINTPVNSNQAQGAPAPLDVVTLAGQAAQGQGTAQNQQDGHDQQDAQLLGNPLFQAAAGLFAGTIVLSSQNGNSAASGQNTSAPQQSSASSSAATTLTTVANTALAQSGSTGSSRPDLTQTQKQELQQLDETLRQLGVDPQNISVFNQLAMLFYNNSPSGLQQFIQQFQQAAEQVLQQGTAAADATDQDSSQTTAAESSSAGATSATPASGTTQPDASSSSQANAVSSKFQELQFAVAAVGGQVQLPSSSADSAPGGESLNVTI